MTSRVPQLLSIMRRLRAADGCPWDRQQTFASIAPYTVEEAYEVADAIDRGDLEHLKDELGDLLFQVVFHAQLASEQGAFDFEAVAGSICEKLIRRHPHVFGGGGPLTTEEQARAWEDIKARERRGNRAPGSEGAPGGGGSPGLGGASEGSGALPEGGASEGGGALGEGGASGGGGAPGGVPTGDSALDGVSQSLPALMRAYKLSKRAARVGFDFEHSSQTADKVEEELAEVREAAAEPGATPSPQIVEEIGDLLFAAANLARKLDVDAESALRAANLKFERRFRAMENLAAARGQEFSALDLNAQESLWLDVKRAE